MTSLGFPRPVGEMEKARVSRVRRHMSPLRLIDRGVRALPSLGQSVIRFENWSELARLYSGLSIMTAPVVARGRKDFRLTMWEPGDVQTLWVVFCANSYRLPRPRGLVLDLGANIGAFSVFASHILGAERIVAVEPVASTFDKLRQNLADNGLSSRVTALRLGVGGKNGSRDIWLGTSSPHASMYHRGDSRFESGETEVIEVITLDDLLNQLGEDVDICKMDCEGAEVEALLAASDDTLRRIRFLCMEYHHPARDLGTTAQLFERLERAGFRCVLHEPSAKLAHFERVA